LNPCARNRYGGSARIAFDPKHEEMSMKRITLLLSLSAMLLLPSCKKSEIDQKPAAEVTETATTSTTTTSATSASDTAATLASSVTTAKVIKEKSSIEFVGAKVTRDHHGKFNNFDGTIGYDANRKPVSVNFDIDLNSIETDTEKLTGHLKSADFFDVAKYPKATFTSTSITEAPAGSPAGTTHMLRGTLDMHGVKKEINVPVQATFTPEGANAKSEFTINRHDWGISYKGAADDLIKDNVLIKLNLFF
jgi:polyisoprenoid-binding protein YceI